MRYEIRPALWRRALPAILGVTVVAAHVAFWIIDRNSIYTAASRVAVALLAAAMVVAAMRMKGEVRT